MKTERCIYCNRDIEIKRIGHRGSMQSHRANCIKYQEYKNKILTKEYLLDEYVNKRCSAKEISLKTSINVKAIIEKLKEYNISTRTLKDACNMDERKEKYKNTCLKNFGCEHNFSRESPHRKQMIEKLIKNYGITNVFQREDVKIKSHISLFHHKGKTQLRKISKIEKIILDYLIESGYDVISNKKILYEGTVRYADCIIGNKIIEVNGDVYHANPKKYKSNDIVCFWGHKDEAHTLWEKDYVKYKQYKKQGYDVLYVWEDDIKNNLDNVKQIIQEYLKEGKHEGFYNKIN